MRFKRLSILFTLVLAFSTFFSSIAFANAVPVKPNLVSLGDSIAFGYKRVDPQPSREAFPYLIGNGKYTVTKNISYPGWRSDQLLANVTKPENINFIKEANVFTLQIGNNDLLQAPGIKEVLENPPAADLPPEQLKLLLDNATIAAGNAAVQITNNLTQIILYIRSLNTDAPIILYNMYNPFAAGPIHELGEKIIPGINEGVIKSVAAQSGSLLADAYSAFNGNQTTYILPDDIHPTSAGHKALAMAGEKALSVLTTKPVLVPSTTEQTTDPVTINVNISAKKVLVLKWLSGEKTINDFSNNGIDIVDNKFQVTKNDTYTVYLLDGLGLESVATIKIDTIKAKEEPAPNPNNSDNQNTTPQPTPTPTPTPTPATPIQTAPTSRGGYTLPNTASPIYNTLAIGLGLILAGFTVMKIQQNRRKTNA
ncbi:GDSL-type esterase/lipase family protein [Bacillus sp. 1P10SD]|uniref:GDSL-type esterase/lipase family protein n=1 Tax=Bacillus sp. 1P10SD TaxID=3132265 RepID=UPI0039A70CD5